MLHLLYYSDCAKSMCEIGLMTTMSQHQLIHDLAYVDNQVHNLVVILLSIILGNSVEQRNMLQKSLKDGSFL